MQGFEVCCGFKSLGWVVNFSFIQASLLAVGCLSDFTTEVSLKLSVFPGVGHCLEIATSSPDFLGCLLSSSIRAAFMMMPVLTVSPRI